MKKILFVCSANIDRSKTAEDLFSKQFPNLSFRSAGTNHKICNQEGTNALCQDDYDWAHLIIVMEQKHNKWMESNLQINGRKTKILHIKDTYKYYSPTLRAILQEKCISLITS